MGSVGGNKNVAVSNNNFSENGQAIAAGSQSGFVMKKDGYVWAFGYNSDGQLGDLSREDSSVPVLVGSGAEDDVSYTHLDVYKRQVVFFFREFRLF